jgi:hypothetical protein
MFGTNYNDHRTSMGYSVRSKEEMDQAFYNRAQWSLKFALVPHRCDIIKKLIWLEYAYCGRAVWTGPGSDAVETRWHSKHEHVIFQLKRA